MFLGTHHPRLDEKGRLVLPARFRDQLAEGLVITKGQERCLALYSLGEFDRVTSELAKAPLTAKRTRAYARVFFASAVDQQPDRQGRISVPAALREYAAIERECAVIGANTHVEIWDAASWEAYERAQDDLFAETDEEGLPGMP